MTASLTHQLLSKQIYYLGAHDHQITKFENIWPIDGGISYNCYLIIDQFCALIDTVESHFSQELLSKISQLLCSRSLDYLVINHMEPDHSGSLAKLKEMYPNLVIIGNHKTTQFAEGFYGLSTDSFKEVQDGETLSLGSHQLQFFLTPMAHWPESMVSYETSQQILFSSDLFGGFQTVDEIPVFENRNDQAQMIQQAREYFATVLGNYTRPAFASLKKLKNLAISSIAPAHGLVWQSQYSTIFDLYWRWSQYLPDMENQPEITIIVGSMYGHTLKMGQLLAQEMENRGIDTTLLDASHTSSTKLLGAVWKNEGLIVGSCTYANGLFPPIKILLDYLTERKIKNRVLGLFGSYSWTGGAMRFLTDFASQSQWTLLKPTVSTQYQLNQDSQKQLVELADSFQSHFNSIQKNDPQES
ncbi:MAG TPA: FprA family A-type flavoprotein [Candidatus Woesebacteria bacterium]|nr:FprA family A-type flavoprotein [Candidatus Woesebacteria bacterium]